MRLTWDERVNLAKVQRPVSERRLTLAGYGRVVDSLLWPILDRFWALGIPTRGSCQGHRVSDHTPPRMFVTVTSGPEPALRRRWLAAVNAFLTPITMPYALFGVDVLGFHVQWHADSPEFPAQQAQVLQVFRDKLDTAGRALVASDPDDWSVWSMPDPGVPDAVDLRNVELPFAMFLSQQPRRVELLVSRRLDGNDWNTIARMLQWTETACREAWDVFWDAWLTESRTLIG